MDDAQLERYSRQLLLPGFDFAGQERLQRARVLVVGLGGLGSPVALYLAAAGVGTLHLADGDRVELSNLQRQILYRDTQLGISKAQAAQQTLQALNADVDLQRHGAVDAAFLEQWLPQVDLLIDCTDRLQTRHMINQACLRHRRPWISAAAAGWSGQWILFDPRQPNTPCYHCLYPFAPEPQAGCQQSGVLGPLVGLIGTQQALEALRWLAGVGEVPVGVLHCYDGLSAQWQRLTVARRQACLCQGLPSAPEQAN